MTQISMDGLRYCHRLLRDVDKLDVVAGIAQLSPEKILARQVAWLKIRYGKTIILEDLGDRYSVTCEDGRKFRVMKPLECRPLNALSLEEFDELLKRRSQRNVITRRAQNRRSSVPVPPEPCEPLQK